MKEDWLNALGLFIYINKGIKLEYSKMIDQFATGNRHLSSNKLTLFSGH